MTEGYRNKRAVGCQLESVCPCISEIDEAYKSGQLTVDNSFDSRGKLVKSVGKVIKPISNRHDVEIGAFGFDNADGTASHGKMLVGVDGSHPGLSTSLIPKGADFAFHTHNNASSVFSIRDTRWVGAPNTGNRNHIPLYSIGNDGASVCTYNTVACDYQLAQDSPYVDRPRRGTAVP